MSFKASEEKCVSFNLVNEFRQVKVYLPDKPVHCIQYRSVLYSVLKQFSNRFQIVFKSSRNQRARFSVFIELQICKVQNSSQSTGTTIKSTNAPWLPYSLQTQIWLNLATTLRSTPENLFLLPWVVYRGITHQQNVYTLLIQSSKFYDLMKIYFH